ncbi:BhlA/UviB family holin-like peptide, partial [Pseudoalteromonas sp. SIMBA_162]|uniref:BhlA/UviB family holin-like peptide n=1 Tax=Pseudoalteromonas sp. SIMBA_162 TaxID=3080867 RepID=UPI003979C126
MEQMLLEFGLKDGIFVAMFIWLLIYVLNTSKERENKLYTFLDGMKHEFAKLVNNYEKLSN